MGNAAPTRHVRCDGCAFEAHAPDDGVPICCPTCGVGSTWTVIPPKPRLNNLTRRERMRLLLKELRVRGNITDACQAAGVGRKTYYRWCEKPNFKKAAEDAMEAATDLLEKEARRRAMHGTLEPVGFHKGKASAYVVRYSDKLLSELLRAHNPKFNTQSIEIRGVLARIDYSKLPYELLKRLSDGEDPVSVFSSGIPEAALLPAPAQALPPGRDLAELERKTG